MNQVLHISGAINPYAHFPNPLWGDPDIVYNGIIGGFNFKCNGLNQTKNYNKLKLTLAPYNLILDKIIIKMDKPIYWEDRFRTQFLASTTNNEFIWYKSVGSLNRGGNNHIIIFNKKLRLNEWFNMNFEERNNLIDSLKEN